MAEEAVTTLRAELDRFGRAEEAFALLEVFLAVARPQLGRLVLDPVGLRLPDQVTTDRALLVQLIQQLEQEPRPRQRVPERVFDADDEQARWDYVRLAYCSNQATVWSSMGHTTYFEASGGVRATYWLPHSLKTEYFAALTAKGWRIPTDWLTAEAKRPRPWWRRGRWN